MSFITEKALRNLLPCSGDGAETNSRAPVEAGGSGPKVGIVTPEDTISPDRRQQQPSTKSRNKPQKAKKRKGFGFGSGGGDDGEQEVFQCELCNITVNSQQQLDMHLTGKIALFSSCQAYKMPTFTRWHERYVGQINNHGKQLRSYIKDSQR